MKNNKLISMREFVLEKTKYIETADYKTANIPLRMIYNYANFLSCPLQLGFFLPCDLEGNVLEEPTHYNEWLSELNLGYVHEYEGLIMFKFKEAQERVLFEEFEVKTNSIDAIRIKNEDLYITFYTGGAGAFLNIPYQNTKGIFSIEDLVKYNLTLTPTAIKEIYG